MPHLSAGQMLVLAFVAILTIIPAMKILPRMGYSPWWAIVAPISPLNIIGLWFLAFARWPTKDTPK